MIGKQMQKAIKLNQERNIGLTHVRGLLRKLFLETFLAPAHITTSRSNGTRNMTFAPSVTGDGMEGKSDANCGV